MATIKAVVGSSDEELVKAHKQFDKWIKANPQWGTSFFSKALHHFRKRNRIITASFSTLQTQNAYAITMATTYVENNKVYWRHQNLV